MNRILDYTQKQGGHLFDDEDLNEFIAEFKQDQDEDSKLGNKDGASLKGLGKYLLELSLKTAKNVGKGVKSITFDQIKGNASEK